MASCLPKPRINLDRDQVNWACPQLIPRLAFSPLTSDFSSLTPSPPWLPPIAFPHKVTPVLSADQSGVSKEPGLVASPLFAEATFTWWFVLPAVISAFLLMFGFL